MKIDNITDRLVRLGTMQKDIAEHLGISPDKVSKVFRGKRQWSGKEIVALDNWLRSGQSKQIIEVKDSNYIPILGKVAAGAWLEESYSGSLKEEKIKFDHLSHGLNASNLFAVIPDGDSMNKIFPENCKLICKHTGDQHWSSFIGRYVIVQRQNHNMTELTCKRLEIEGDNFALYSESTNPAHQKPILIKNGHDDSDYEISLIGNVIRHVVEY